MSHGSALKDFLSQRKVDKGDSYTHTIIGGHGYVGGSYYVSHEDRSELYQLLSRVVFGENGSVSLTEKPSENSVLRIDVDLRYPADQELRQYTADDVRAIINTYNQTLLQYLEIERHALMCYVMEREEPYTDPKNRSYVKDGIHLMYPNVVLSKKNYGIIRRLVLPRLKERLSDLLEKNTLNVESMIDAAIVDNNWLLYGCSKPSTKPYLLTHVYDCDENDLSEQLSSNPEELVDLLKVNLPDRVEPTQVKPDHEALFELIEARVKKPVFTTGETVIVEDKNRIKNVSSVDLDEIRKLVKLLSTERADDRNTWIKVGWCLRNLSHDLLPEWIHFSKKSQKYDDGVCEKEWIKTNPRSDGFSIGSLHRWAKEDDPQGYAQVTSQRIDNLIKKAGSCTHQDVAHLIHHLYKEQFVCTDGGKKTEKIWYKFSSHRWSECDGKVNLQALMGLQVPNFCRLAKVRINEQSAQTEDDEIKNRLDKADEEIQKLITKLKDATFKEKVFKECLYMFYDEHFFRKLDENIDLIGCENGIYNLKTGEFRDGQPEDYISLSTGVNYQIEDEHGLYTESHPYVRAINRFFQQIQPKEDVCTYLKLLLGGCLFGRNINEQFYILEGVGGNGKSKMIELMENALGPYASSISSNYFTQKRPPSQAANPDFCKIVHARMVTAQETEEGEKFNISVLKSLVGNDKITYRPLYGPCREVRPKFNILMAVNHLPTLPPDDIGTWRRVRLIRFLSRFVDNPDPNSLYEHKKDPLLADKFQKWREAVQFMLFQWHREFRNGKFKEPADVLEATRAYQKQNDQYSEFLDRFVLKRAGAFVQLDALFNMLKEWWDENASGVRPDKKQFRSMLEKRWGKAENNREYGAGWKDLELCDSIEMIKTTDANNEQITYFGI
jgi:P4 family phage/plasmid primase-like protien